MRDPGGAELRQRQLEKGEAIMLSEATVHGVIPASDLERAKKFYESALGLRQEEGPACPGCIPYSTKQGAFLVYETQAPGSGATALSFNVDDLAAEMADLRKRGVMFEEYDYPGLKTVNGVADMAGVAKAAWFKDSEGNIISLTQM